MDFIDIEGGHLPECEAVDVIDPIESVNPAISYYEFFGSFLMKNRPCVFQTEMTRDWQSVRTWCSKSAPNFELLKEFFGDSVAPIANCNEKYYDSQTKVEMTLNEYIDYWIDYKQCNYSKDKKVLYLKDWHFVKNHPEDKIYEVPKYFASDWLNEYYMSHSELRDDYMFIYMGPKGTWTPFHVDVFTSYSWSANICGKKRWLLYPPGQENHFRDIYGNLIYDVTSVDINDTKKFKNYDPGNLKCFEIFQNAGEVIFVPSGWHHQVWNLSPPFLTEEPAFVSSENPHLRIKTENDSNVFIKAENSPNEIPKIKTEPEFIFVDCESEVKGSQQSPEELSIYTDYKPQFGQRNNTQELSNSRDQQQLEKTFPASDADPENDPKTSFILSRDLLLLRKRAASSIPVDALLKEPKCEKPIERFQKNKKLSKEQMKIREKARNKTSGVVFRKKVLDMVSELDAENALLPDSVLNKYMTIRSKSSMPFQLSENMKNHLRRKKEALDRENQKKVESSSSSIESLLNQVKSRSYQARQDELARKCADKRQSENLAEHAKKNQKLSAFELGSQSKATSSSSYVESLLNEVKFRSYQAALQKELAGKCIKRPKLENLEKKEKILAAASKTKIHCQQKKGKKKQLQEEKVEKEQ